MSIQLQREKKAPAAPSLDPNLARRIPLRLLLADDNPINQKVGLSVLQKLGYRADLANNGLEVLKALEQKVYDVLFLDVQMPEMDGLEAAQQICRKWPPDKRPCIIAMTGNALMGDRERCLAAGMDDYISKPVRGAELQAALEHWGPSRSRKSDTSFATRVNFVSAAALLDPAVLGDLQAMPPTDAGNMLNELIDLFLQEAPLRLTEIQQAVKNPSNLAFHAHALKSMSLNLGARRVVDLCQKIETLAHTGATDQIPALVQELQAVFIQTKGRLLPMRSAPCPPNPAA